MDYSERIKGIRKAKGLSQVQVAESVGISQAAYGKIESGFTKSISIDIGVGIAKSLGVSFVQLFDIEETSEIFLEQTYTISKLRARVKELEERIKEKDDLNKLLKSQNRSLLKEALQFHFERDLHELMYNENSIAAGDATQKETANRDQRILTALIRLSVEDIQEKGLSNFDVIEILYNSDPMVKRFEQDEQDVAKRLTQHWNQFMNITESEVNDFLALQQRRSRGASAKNE